LSLKQFHVFLVRAVNQNRNLPTHAERTYIGYGECQQSSGACIGGVPALFQNLDASRSSGRPTGNNHALAAGGDARPSPGDRRFSSLRPSQGREYKERETDDIEMILRITGHLRRKTRVS